MYIDIQWVLFVMKKHDYVFDCFARVKIYPYVTLETITHINRKVANGKYRVIFNY